MVALMPSFMVPNEARIEVNRQVLSFCLLTSGLTGILFGLAPALQSSRPNLVESLKGETRGAGSSGGGKTRAMLVVAEVALSVLLLVSAGLTVRAFLAMQRIDLGFRPERVLVVNVPLAPKRYVTWDQRNRFFRELLERVQHLPGVEAATVGFGGLPFGGPDSAYAIEGHAETETRRLVFCEVGAGHLRTLGVPLRRGRMLTAREVDAAEPLAVVNEAAAKLWAPGEDPIGRRLRLEILSNPGWTEIRIPTNASPYVTVIGVIGDTRNDGLRTQPQPAVFIPYPLLAPPGRNLAIRTTGDPKQLLNALRAQVSEMDKEQLVAGSTTFEEEVAALSAQPRFAMTLFAVFAALGLALAMAGIYSVLSYVVARRTREIGVRLALGAQRSDILYWVFRAGGGWVGTGMALGIVASLAAARLLAAQLDDVFHITAADPVPFLGVMVLLALVAAAACLVPAQRAARVDPMEALRHE